VAALLSLGVMLNHKEASGADGVWIAVFRGSHARLVLIQSAAHRQRYPKKTLQPDAS
jgi:hypothetical protein